MPPPDVSDAAAADKIAVIEQWIKEGAKLDAGIDAKADLLSGAARPLEAARAAASPTPFPSPSPPWRSRRTTRNSSSAAITS